MVGLVQGRFGLTVHPRSLERALARLSSPSRAPGADPDSGHSAAAQVEDLGPLYERLRAQAIAPSEAGERPRGWGLFLRRGMPAWILAMVGGPESLVEVTEETGTEQIAISTDDLAPKSLSLQMAADADDEELAVVLTNMAYWGRTARTTATGSRA